MVRSMGKVPADPHFFPQFVTVSAGGAKNEAIVEPFTAAANAGGAHVIQFAPTQDQGLVCGLEVQERARDRRLALPTGPSPAGRS